MSWRMLQLTQSPRHPEKSTTRCLFTATLDSAKPILCKPPDMKLFDAGQKHEFSTSAQSNLPTNTSQQFRAGRFRESDLLLVDDIQFLKGKEATQEEFFHTFNALYEAGRQIVMTSDRSPSEIPGIEARLVSRFQWGMVADIELPDLEHRIAILHHKAQVDHLEHTVPESVIRFVAENVRSSVRELEGSVIKLLAYASLKHRDITIDLAREALRDKLRGDGTNELSPSLSIATVQKSVADEWGVTTEGLKSKTRTKTLTIPRQAAMYLCREVLGLQLVEIGNSFGGRDHSTVIHSLERAAILMKEEQPFRHRVEKLRTLLESMK
jgi:chromosomal replication initiator protein